MSAKFYIVQNPDFNAGDDEEAKMIKSIIELVTGTFYTRDEAVSLAAEEGVTLGKFVRITVEVDPADERT